MKIAKPVRNLCKKSNPRCNPRYLRNLLLCLILLPVVLLYAETAPLKHSFRPQKTIKQVRRALNRIKPFKISFTQQLFSDDEMAVEESGEILFVDQHHLKWTYLEPDFKVFLLQDNTYKFYDEENEQLNTGKIESKNQQWIWQLFFSDDIFPYAKVETFETIATAEEKRKNNKDNKSNASNTDGKPILSAKKIIIKKNQGEEQLDIEIILDNRSLPVKVTRNQHDSGTRMVFYFSDYKEKVNIPEDTFQLKVPEDVEIIDDNENR
ncbi:MAG: hypothetical protein GY757_61285 [bacterium]|nr:hypothetical protein [bacterium]